MFFFIPEILQTHRASRGNLDNSLTENFSQSFDELYQNCTEMHITDVNDVLGPLPQIPSNNESQNWSRRISEIYEEIPDTSMLNTRNSRRVSGVSVASGIYEEMTPVLDEEEEKHLCYDESILSDGEKCETPPALPPRLRVNTLEIHRSYTNPETATFKKKTRTVFSSMFSRSKRSTSCSESPQNQTPVKNCVVVKDVEVVPKRRIKSRFLGFDLLENKRNSFSSPDLTKFNQYSNDYFDAVDIGSCSSEFEIFGSTSSSSNNTSNDFLNIDFNFTTEGVKEEELNISERINSNFNISCNTSTVNLVGSNCNSDEEQILSKRKNLVFIDDLSGYCIMKPIIPKKDQDGLRLVTLERGLEKEFKFEDLFKGDKNDVILYENIKNLKIMDNKPIDNLLKEEQEEEEEFYKSPKTRTFDDKVPSYFPNNCSTTKPRKIIVKNLTNLTVSNNENFYTPSPLNKKDSIRRKFIKKKSPEVPSTNVYIEEIKSDDSFEEEVKPQPTTPRLYQKYATLARLSPTRYLSQKKNVDGGGTVKRFASLPRFKKIDFSPLKIKINAVLQRHNSEF